MKKTQDISQIFRQMRVPASSKLDERVHREIDNATALPASAPAGPEPTLGQLFALFLKRPSARYTLATTLGLAMLVALALIRPAPSAWAMEQAVEALKKYRGLQMSGNYTKDGKTYPVEVWFRAEVAGNFVEAALGKVGDVATIWTEDNKTYTYDRDDKMVYVEPGITQAFDPWPGPELLTQFSKEKDYNAIEGDDPARAARVSASAMTTLACAAPAARGVGAP